MKILIRRTGITALVLILLVASYALPALVGVWLKVCWYSFQLGWNLI
jgi:hypothetical protein